MGTYTPKFNLYKTNMQTDGNDLFDFDRDINENLTKIENGVAIANYSSTAIYSLGDVVLAIVDNKVKLFKSKTNNNTGNALTNTTYWEEVSLGGGVPIGTIYSVVCSSSYVPTGALPCNGSEYSKEQFNDLWNNYIVTGLLNTCTYTQYQSDIATYGQCGKFAVNTTNNKFKVPTIKNGSYITQANSDTELGKSYNESLPNITGSLGDMFMGVSTDRYTDGAFSTVKNSGRNYSSSSGSDNGWYTSSFNASNSSSTYQDNAHVQGDNVRLRYFIQVASGQINQTDMDWSAWASSLQGKLNTTGTTNATSVDGQFVYKKSTIATATTTSTSTYSLSSYLPNDNYQYMVKVCVNLYYNGSTILNVGSDILTLNTTVTDASQGKTIWGGANSRHNANIFDIPVGTGRTIKSICNVASSDATITLLGYRRIGTNS